MFDSAWALFEGVVVFGGYSELPVVNLGLEFIRALAVVAVSSAAVDIGLGAAFRGERSIVVYLAFFLPMATMRALLLKFAPGLDLGLVALIVTMVAAITPLLFYAVVKDTRLSFLFRADGLGQAQARAAAHPRFGPALGPAMRWRL